MLCNPFTGLFSVSTFWSHCARQDSLSQFAWVDTRETLADYRRRVRGTVPARQLLLHRLIRLMCLVLLPLAGALLLRWLWPTRPILALILGLLAGLAVGVVTAGLTMGMDRREFHLFR